MTFCKASNFETALVAALSQNVWHTDHANIAALYDFWRTGFNNGRKGIEKKEVITKNAIAASQSIPSDARLCGIDLPVWLGELSEVGKRIMMVSQDPLRDENVFVNVAKASPEDSAIIGTPFAAHLNFKTKNTQTGKTGKFLNKLIENGNFLYLTDLYKTFYRCNNHTSVNVRIREKHESKSPHVALLEQEIYLVKPDLIICLGQKSFGALSHLFGIETVEKQLRLKGCDIPVLHLVHPTAYKYDQVKFYENYGIKCGDRLTHDKTIEYLNQITQEALKGLVKENSDSAS